MGKDVPTNRKKRPGRKVLTSPNVYRKLLVKLYEYLKRRTDSKKYHEMILRRLRTSRQNRQPLSLSRLKRLVLKQQKVAAIVGTVTDDLRVLEVPKMTVCALNFTTNARTRIMQAGGECMSFDQLALRHPTGEGVMLLRGPPKKNPHFGKAPGTPHSIAKAYTPHRRAEKARGRRSSCGYKVKR
eukprot:Filipodium_phascolosomae@DN348_c0_g1_i1.p1